MISGQRTGDDDHDFCFTRLSADQLARAIIGDMRHIPTAEQLAAAHEILNRTGSLYRLVAGFRIEEWSRKAS